MNDNAIEVTRSRLVGHRGKYREISRLMGASYSWLSKFARGERGKQPSFDLINRLQNTLDELDGSAGQGSNGTDQSGTRTDIERPL